MSRLRIVSAAIACLGLATGIACLWRAANGSFDWGANAFLPMILVVAFAWFHALTIAARVGQSSSIAKIPGWAVFPGLYRSTVPAPFSALGTAVVGAIALFFFGRTGSVHEWPATAHQVQIAYSALTWFLVVGLPTLLTRHPDAP